MSAPAAAASAAAATAAAVASSAEVGRENTPASANHLVSVCQCFGGQRSRASVGRKGEQALLFARVAQCLKALWLPWVWMKNEE